MIARTLALIFGLAFAGTASQAPEFAQQYRQRLGGAIDELARIVAAFEADARDFGITRSEALARLTGNADPLVARRGTRMADTISRLESLQEQRAAMGGAGPFARMAIIVRDADTPLAEATARDYEPAVPLTTEGLVSAGAGFGVGYVLWRLLAGLLRLSGRAIRPRREA